MPRPTPIALTEAEKRDLVTLIQQGHALPEKYRFVLFEDKREVELVWNGKTRVVCTTVLPFQTLEHVDEPPIPSLLRGFSAPVLLEQPLGDDDLRLLARHGERVRVRVSNGGGQVLSSEALLSVNAAGAPRAWQTAQRLRAAEAAEVARQGGRAAAQAVLPGQRITRSLQVPPQPRQPR